MKLSFVIALLLVSTTSAIRIHSFDKPAAAAEKKKAADDKKLEEEKTVVPSEADKKDDQAHSESKPYQGSPVDTTTKGTATHNRAVGDQDEVGHMIKVSDAIRKDALKSKNADELKKDNKDAGVKGAPKEAEKK